VVILEHRPQRSFFDGISCDERRDEGYAAPLDRRVAQHFRNVCTPRPFRLDPMAYYAKLRLNFPKRA
jgi:hypothetical protein